ncbi:MAG: hypothetical protein RIS79_2561 [Verrucomicrobiota bacterium]
MKYHVARKSEQLGEFSDLDISAGLRNGQLQPGDLCWAPGMPDWEALSERFAPSTEPPPPASEPPPLPPLAPDPEWSLASRAQRLGAWLLDSLSLLPVVYLGAKGIEEHPIQTMEELMKVMQEHPELFQTAAWTFIGITLVNVVMLSMRGQSIGKWLTGIQIVMFQSGAPAGFVRAVLLRSFVMSVLGSVAYVGVGIQLFDILCIFRQDRRCLHDLIADTMVIKVRRS